ncbi:MAG: hypothetical protein Q9M36_12380 [Sulfurovum sp.]|nr:hypothetical protein [Sulfurovum sp.]
MGGGDGLALREVLSSLDKVKHITLVDSDEAVTTLFKTHPRLSTSQ